MYGRPVPRDYGLGFMGLLNLASRGEAIRDGAQLGGVVTQPQNGESIWGIVKIMVLFWVP